MIFDDEMVRKIKKMTTMFSNDEEKKSFLINSFRNFSDNDKAKIISFFIQRLGRRNFYHYVEDIKVKKEVMNCCKSAINTFIESLDNDECNLYFDLICMYVYLNDGDLETENDTLDKIMSKFNEMLNKNVIYNKEQIIEFLTSYIKFMVYRTNGNKKRIKLVTESHYFSILENIVLKYIEKVNVNSDSLNDSLLMLLLEVRKMPGFMNIDKLLIDKGNTNDFSNYYEYIKNNTLVEPEQFSKFCEAIVFYKLSNGILPREVCIYLYKFYEKNDKLIRLVMDDLIQNYLVENGVDDIICFKDPLNLSGGACANTKYIVLRESKLGNITIFHEATHCIQFRDMDNNKNFIRYKYDMLKDFLIRDNLPNYRNYRGVNHDRLLQEIDADIQGSRQYGMFLLGVEEDEDKINSIKKELNDLDKKEQKRIDESKTIFVNGEEVNKKDYFDMLILKFPSYIKYFPVLSIEYNEDGSKKNSDEILYALESCRLNKVYTEEEITAIKACIFGESIEKEKTR